MSRPTVLITGAARRIGRATALAFAKKGCNLVLHYNQSEAEATKLADELNQLNDTASITVQADLNAESAASQLVDKTLNHFNRLDHLVNNASVFYPTPLIHTPVENLSAFLTTNLFAPVRLINQAATAIKTNKGSIVNLIDIYADAGLADHSFYVAAKSALKTITHACAQRFAPDIRVNGVSPGAILWPDIPVEQAKKKAIINHSALKTLGHPENIAETIVYLCLNAHYTTGSIIRVDGGRRDYL